LGSVGYSIVGVDNANPLGYIVLTVTRNPERTVTMSKHSQHYFDLNPKRKEPPDWLIALGAIVCGALGTFALIVLMQLPAIVRG
jgi:hypothetical protein